MNLNYQTKEGGFSLVEALVAIFILSVAIVAPLQIAYQGIAATTFAKNQLTAEFLAQDVAEFVTARKEEDPLGWLNTFENCNSATHPNGCLIKTDVTSRMDIVSGDIGTCGTVCTPMQLNTEKPTTTTYGPNYGSYTQSGTGNGWIDTKFTRKILLTQQSCNGNKVRVVLGQVTVGWGSSIVEAKKTYTLRTNLYFEDSSCN